MSDKFRAIVTRETEDGKGVSALEEINKSDLPDGDVLIKVSHAAVNYKDGLALSGLARIIREFPHVCGVDFVGEVAESNHASYKEGDKVVANGWRIGEVWWGGYSEYASVKGDWLVPLPDGMSLADGATVGIAGLTAGISINALKHMGVTPDKGPVLVTGSSGGVGSFCVRMLKGLGYEVAAVSGRPENEGYLKELGAAQVIPRENYAEGTKKPLSKELWAGCIDNAGGPGFNQIVTELNYGGTIAAVGLAAGSRVQMDLITMFVRGVNILGIDSVQAPVDVRKAALDIVHQTMAAEDFATIRHDAVLADVPTLGKAILKGGIKGRAVVDVTK